MRMRLLALTVVVAFGLVTARQGLAEDWFPLQAALWGPQVQLVPADWSINGLRLCAGYGENAGLSGLDIGLAGRATGDVTGVQAALAFNLVEADVAGLQLAGGFNIVNRTLWGAEVALLGNLASPGRVVKGAQVAAGYNSCGEIAGCQAALVNVARYTKGVQIGLVNVSREVHGLQIGLLNINRTGWLRYCPLLNWGFGER